VVVLVVVTVQEQLLVPVQVAVAQEAVVLLTQHQGQLILAAAVVEEVQLPHNNQVAQAVQVK
jgi:hypothetical protein